MTYPLKQSSTAQALVFYMVASSDHIAAGTGLTCTVTIRKSGGSFASPGGAVTEIANGWYQVAGNATDTNTLGPLLLHATATGADPTDVCYHVVAYDPQDAVRAGLTALPNAAAEAAGGLYTRGAGAGQINQNASGQVDTRTVAMATDVITAAAIQADAIGAAEIANGAIDAATFAAGAIDASAIATDAFGALELAAGAATEIAAAVWDEARASHTTAGTFGQGAASVQGNVTGSVASVTGAVGSVTGAVGSVTGNVGGNVTGSVGSVTGAVGSVTGNVGGNVTGSVGSVATGGITAASIAADAIGASELAADAVAEIAAAVSVGSAPTAAQNAAAVWDLAISGHTTAATFGNKVNGLTSGGSGGPVGSGSTSYPVTVTRQDGTTPIEGAAVWVSTDIGGINVVAGTLYTDTLGRINNPTGFMLDPGTYYLWRQLAPHLFTNPTAFTVS